MKHGSILSDIFPLSRVSSQRKSTLTGIEEPHIEFLIYRKRPKLVEFFGTAVSPNYFSKIRRVSPSFLQNSGYQKAIWGLRCFSFDPSNMERLVDRCPGCDFVLTYRFTAGPCYCGLCGYDLRNAPKETAGVSDLRTDFVRYLIDPTHDGHGMWSLHEDLRRLSRSEIFALIVTLGSLLDYEKVGGVDANISTKFDQFDLSLESLVEASSAALDWPDGFYRVAEKVRCVKRHLSSRLAHPVVLGIPVGMRPLKNFVNREIRKDTGRSVSRLHNFGSDGNKRTAFRYRFPKSVESDVSSLRLPRAEVLEIYRMGAIYCPDRKLRDMLGSSNTEARRVAEFLEQVPFGCAGLPLRTVVIASRTTRHPWAAAFDAIFRGQVSISQVKGKEFASRFYTTDIVKLKEICSAAEPLVDGSTEITSADAQFYLSVCKKKIGSFKRAGLLSNAKLTLNDVWKFQDNFMTTAEIRSRLQIVGKVTFAQGLWPLIDSLGFDRAAPRVLALTRADGEAFLRHAQNTLEL